jgi:hypothetical protein
MTFVAAVEDGQSLAVEALEIIMERSELHRATITLPQPLPTRSSASRRYFPFSLSATKMHLCNNTPWLRLEAQVMVVAEHRSTKQTSGCVHAIDG